MKLTPKAEEILETLWIVTVEGGDNAAALDTLRVKVDDGDLLTLDRLAYVEIKGERVYLRPEGREEAKMTVRRHRLAERLLRGFLSKALFDAGLYCRADDRGDPVIQLAPPLIIGQKEFDEIEQTLRSVLTEAAKIL